LRTGFCRLIERREQHAGSHHFDIAKLLSRRPLRMPPVRLFGLQAAGNPSARQVWHEPCL